MKGKIISHMELYKNKVVKDGKTYTDLNVSWSHEGKTYIVRVRPVFARDFALLLSHAEPLPELAND